jgi:antitoxin component YwqK of YwqJK toxin-antitoxin module
VTDAYVSSIPESAAECVIERYPRGEMKRAEYLLNGEVVGVREFHLSAEPSSEYALRNGVRHGVHYRWDPPGKLLSATPYVDGLEHGVARQWAADGTLIGAYTMRRGTGLDLWWRECGGAIALAEARHLRGGRRHGFEWWIGDDQATVREERHLWQGELHGVEREWNLQGRLRRGFPRYFIHGQRVTRVEYLRAQAADATLPPFDVTDNNPARAFPPAVAQHLRPSPA